MTLDATPGGASANSYVSVSDALTLLRLTLEGDVETIAVQTRLTEALIWATQLIEQQVDWYGAPVTSTQALSWPQAGVDRVGRTLSLTTIPVFLQQATAEYALALIRDSIQRETVATASLASGMQGVKRLAIDDVRIEVADNLREQTTTILSACTMPDTVRRLLRPYGDVAGGMTVRLVRM